jgi:hypothetical protein
VRPVSVFSTNRVKIASSGGWSITELAGYDNPGPFVRSGGNALITPKPKPRLRVRRTAMSIDVRDGHTIVIAGFGAMEPQEVFFWDHSKGWKLLPFQLPPGGECMVSAAGSPLVCFVS